MKVNWIPVVKELPKCAEWQFEDIGPKEGYRFSEVVIVCTAARLVTVAHYSEATNDGGQSCIDGGWLSDSQLYDDNDVEEVVQWTPLPEPYPPR